MERNMLFRELAGLQPAALNREADTLDHFLPLSQFASALKGIPPKISDETGPGYTCYVGIDTGLDAKSDRCYAAVKKTDPSTNKTSFVCTNYVDVPLQKKTAIFAPTRFNPAQPADMIIYLHGHLAGHPGIKKAKGNHSPDIQEYLGYKTKPYFNLRELVEASGKNMLLVAPTLGPRSQYGNLVKNFDDYMTTVLAAVNEHIIRQRNLNGNFCMGRLIIAAHSGGGSAMQGLAQLTSGYGAKVNEYWGFDSWYNSSPAWAAVASQKPGVQIFGYYYNSGNIPNKPAGNNKRLQTKNLAVIQVSKDAPATDHYTLLPWYFKERVNGAAAQPAPATTTPAAPAKTPAAPAPAATGTTGFTLTTMPLGTSPIVVGKYVEKKEVKATVKEAPSVFMPEIVRRALGAQGSNWFKNFTRITFLGRKFKSGQYIHMSFAKLLQQVEQQFAAKYGGPAKDPKIAGDLLLGNHEVLRGSRQTSATATFSMHMFGLAIDVNYERNPFIEKGDIKTVNTALEKAGWLVNGAKSKLYAHGISYNDISLLDKLLEKYFDLFDKPAQLQQQLDQSPAGSPWKSMSAAAAVKSINQDLTNVATKLARGSNKDVIKKGGILDLPKEFVEGMIKGGFNWGGFYGDNMHFDMRDTGVGALIDRERKKYGAEKNKEAKTKYLGQ